MNCQNWILPLTSRDLNTKQNPDGIGATPKVTPKVDELPELDITADIPSDLTYKTKS